MNIGYLIFIELLESPLIQGQVVDVLKKILKSEQHAKIYLISFWGIHPFIRSQKEEYYAKKIREEGINLIRIPIIYSKWWFFSKWYMLPLLFLQIFPALLILSIVKKINIFHCRSYPITLPALAVKRLRKIRIIFDARSDFPEESVVAEYWKKDSIDYKMWKFFEKKYLDHCDAIIAISEIQKKNFKKINGDAAIYVIYNIVDTERFKLNEVSRINFRRENLIQDDEIIISYCGALGKNWNNTEYYAEYIIKMRSLKYKHRFLFITTDVPYLKKALRDYGIEDREYITISSDFEDVPRYLSAADIGITVMHREKPTLAVKTVEYLSMGMPVIINSNLCGAKDIIRENEVGLIYDLETDIKNLNLFIENFVKDRERVSLNCRRLAKIKFSVHVISGQYREVYSEIL